MQEKAAAKTAIRVQKESEKKLKEHEKKAKKKASAAGPDIDPEEWTRKVVGLNGEG